MNKLLYVFISLLFVCFFVSCKKDNNSPSVLMVGRWNLTRLAIKGYSNNVIQSDTTFYTSSNFTDYVEFNKDGSFVNGFDSGVIDTVKGTYKISGMNLSFVNVSASGGANIISTPFPEFFNGSFGNTDATSGASSSSTITQITPTALIIHSELTFKVSASVTEKDVRDQYYSR